MAKYTLSEDKDDTTKSEVDIVLGELKLAYSAKKKLIEREQEDHLFALGDQWSKEDIAAMEAVNIKPVVDNRIAPNLFLLTGLERQNRAEFKAFPLGEEDGLEAEITSILFKDVIRKSGYPYKSSEQFKDGITCGESHLEPYLDYKDNLINGKLCWKKIDGDMLIPDPMFREYDFSDARYIFKLKFDLSKADLIELFPKKEEELELLNDGKLDLEAMLVGGVKEHNQPRDYTGKNGDPVGEEDNTACFDLIEKYYKKRVERNFIADHKTGQIRQVESAKIAKEFLAEYKAGIKRNQDLYAKAVHQAVADAANAPGTPVQHPPEPPEQDPKRFFVLKQMVEEIWCLSIVPGLTEPVDDSVTWFYPKWKTYPFVPYFARFSTAPIKDKNKRHLLIQGLVHGVKGAQEKHNKAEMLMLRHLNTTANSGWLVEEDTWVDEEMVKKFGTAAGVDLVYNKGRQKPERITPSPLSQGHVQISVSSAESIKDQLGINADLLAANEGGGDSGRAISLRQKQGLLMIQELYDNLTRSRIIAGRFILTQLGEIFDTETAMKVLGSAFLIKNFAPPMLPNPEDPEAEPTAMMDKNTGEPMVFDKELAETTIAKILQGDLGEYDVTVGESVASETQKMANAAELADFDKNHPGLIPPAIVIKNSQLPESSKKEIIEAIQQQMQLMAAKSQGGESQPDKKRK